MSTLSRRQRQAQSDYEFRELRVADLQVKLALDENAARVLAALETDHGRIGFILPELSARALMVPSAVNDTLAILSKRQLVTVATEERVDQVVYKFTSL